MKSMTTLPYIEIPVLFDKTDRESRGAGLSDDIYILVTCFDPNSGESHQTAGGRKIKFNGVQNKDADHYLFLSNMKNSSKAIVEARQYGSPVSFSDIANTISDDEGCDEGAGCVQFVVGRTKFAKGTATVWTFAETSIHSRAVVRMLASVCADGS